MNATICKLILGRHGYHETSKQELSGVDGGAIKTDNAWKIEFVTANKQ